MVPLQNFATGVLADVIQRQPPSPSRTTFAMDRRGRAGARAHSATATLNGGRAQPYARAMRAGKRGSNAPAPRSWRGMQQLLGRESVVRVEIVS
jgi:hypothetical protein